MNSTTLYLLSFFLISGLGCNRTPSSSKQSAKLPVLPLRPAAMAHGGVGAPPELSDGCRRAVDAALAVLSGGSDPLDAAVAGAAILEDDPRYNAGTGSRVRLDGVTVQMDASVMSSDGRFGAVGAIELVKNPVRVARAVVDTPHLFLVGDGATRFARTLGMPPYDPATKEMREKTAHLRAQLRTGDPSLPPEWRRFDWRRHWNFASGLDEPEHFVPPPGSKKDAGHGHDTIGVVVRASDGRFAVALSTGGTAMTLRGRVGDVPIYGAGQYAGRFGAVAATGSGERIIEASLGRTVYGWLEGGALPQQAAERAVSLLRDKGDLGIIVLSAEGMAAAASQQFAWAGREAGGAWLGPTR